MKKSFPNNEHFPLINEVHLNPYRMKRSLRKWFWRNAHHNPLKKNHKNGKTAKAEDKKVKTAKTENKENPVDIEDNLLKNDIHSIEQVTKEWERNMLKGITRDLECRHSNERRKGDGLNPYDSMYL